jgi:SAM-dependent methyltransferase
VACLLCGSDALVLETERYTACQRCGTLSQRHPPPRAAVEESEARYTHDILPAERRWLALVAEAGPAERTLLDLGAGNGGFVGLARDHGWRARGLEGSAAMVARAVAAGWPLHVADLDEWEAEGQVGVVRLWFVLEHIRLPGRLLREACRAVAPGGLLVVAVPNDAGWLSRRVMRSDADRFWEHPLHLHHFPPFGLEEWLVGLGFERILGEAGRPTELMRDGHLPLHEAWEQVREWDPSLSRLFYQLGVGRSREMIFRRR